MSLAARIAWADTILPFQLDRADIRGRVARIDQALERILGQHDYPAAVAARRVVSLSYPRRRAAIRVS